MMRRWKAWIAGALALAGLAAIPGESQARPMAVPDLIPMQTPATAGVSGAAPTCQYGYYRRGYRRPFYGYGYRRYGYRRPFYGYRRFGYRRPFYGYRRPYGFRHRFYRPIGFYGRPFGYHRYGYRPYGYRHYGY